MRNQKANINNAVSAPMAPTWDALVERLQVTHNAASLLYNRIMDNIEHGWERLKNIVEKETEEETTE